MVGAGIYVVPFMIQRHVPGIAEERMAYASPARTAGTAANR